MQFKVPQDVQREDTIIGPITLRQLIILGVGGGIDYTIYISLAKSYFIEIWLPPVAFIGGLTLAFAFLKIHNLTFMKFLMAFLEYHLLSKKRIWIEQADEPFMFVLDKLAQTAKTEEKAATVKSTENLDKLAAISKILDSHGKSELDQTEKKQGLKAIINQNYEQKPA